MRSRVPHVFAIRYYPKLFRSIAPSAAVLSYSPCDECDLFPRGIVDLPLRCVPMCTKDEAAINARTRGGSAADNERSVEQAHGCIKGWGVQNTMDQ